MASPEKYSAPKNTEAGLLIAQRKFQWEQPWNSIQHNKEILQNEGLPLIIELGRAPLPTESGNWTYFAFGDYTDGSHHELLVFGNYEEGSLEDGEDVLVRMHSACRTNEVYHSINCECRKEMNQAMDLISKEGKGVIVYLEQEGRGTGISGKMHQLNEMFSWEDGVAKIIQNVDAGGTRVDTYHAYLMAGLPSEIRDFDVAGQMLKQIGIKSVRLLTNNPAKMEGIESANIRVERVALHIVPDNEIIASDLRSKAAHLGHEIGEDHLKVNKD